MSPKTPASGHPAGEPEPRTVRGLRRVLNAVFAGVLVGTALGASAHADAVRTQGVGNRPGYADELERHYRCWTRDAPAEEEGKIPAGVIVRHGRRPPVHESTGGAVGAALDHVFAGRHPRLTVLAFCAR